jgi:arylsulfatase A-like enzyme
MMPPGRVTQGFEWRLHVDFFHDNRLILTEKIEMNKVNKTRRQALGGLSALMLSQLPGLARAQGATPLKDRQPNIIFIMADDMGYADLSVYGQPDFKTPNIDRLAEQGVRFTQAYANSAVCSASRFGLITGRYQYRLRGGLEEPLSGVASDIYGLPASHPTLPSRLKLAGYKTALIGKWHLGNLPNFGPLKSGYDSFYGNYGPGLDYYTHKFGIGASVPTDLYENEVPADKAGYYTDLLGQRAVDFIDQQDRDKPYFLSVHYTAPHWPWQAPGDDRPITSLIQYDEGNLEIYAKIMISLDDSVGSILDALERSGQAENTIVIFTSDNGGERFSNVWPFSGQKTELLEGGVRIPSLMRWPKKLKGGQVSSQVTVHMDWMPTLLAAAGGSPDPAYPSDGMNLMPILMGASPNTPRTLFWRYKSNTQRAVRSGNFKYLKINGNEFLFDVVVDQRERANLKAKYPDVFANLKAQWDSWNATMVPITASVRSHLLTPAVQADRYNPDTPVIFPAD